MYLAAPTAKAKARLNSVHIKRALVTWLFIESGVMQQFI